jgi:hypothetical protein
MSLPTLRTDVMTGDSDHAALHNEERARLNVLSTALASVYDVGLYGAVGDGVADDTTALAAALTAAAEDGGTVFLRAGTYRITDTIAALQNSGGVVIRGDGMPGHYRPATRLVWDGATDGRAVLDLSGTGYIHLEDIGFYANLSAPGTASNVVGIKAIGNPAYWGSYFNSSRRLFFQNFAVGADLGSASDQVDTWTWDKCWFVYDTADGIGVRINSSNALVLQFMNCTLTGAGESEMASSAGVHLSSGSVKMYGCVTARNKYGVRFTAQPSGTSGLFGHHSEGDGTAVYTDSTDGNHQKANSITVSDLYVYHSQDAMLRFENENMQYAVTGAYSQPAGGVDDIIVPDDTQSVWLWNVTHTGTVRRASDLAAVNVAGWYGAQGPSARNARLPVIEAPSVILSSPNGTRYRVAVSDAGVLAATAL